MQIINLGFSEGILWVWEKTMDGNRTRVLTMAINKRFFI
jgi:hypothetical protein